MLLEKQTNKGKYSDTVEFEAVFTNKLFSRANCKNSADPQHEQEKKLTSQS